MTQRTSVPKSERPAAIERLLRDYRGEHPGEWMPWKEVLGAVGGSERDLTEMMRSAKEKIQAEEAAVAAMPELPDEIKLEFERFALSVWKQSCDFADVNASELRHARRVDREKMERERSEYGDIIGSLVQERDDLQQELDELSSRNAEQNTKLAEQETELREVRAALEELRALFADLTAASKAADTEGEENPARQKAPSARKAAPKQTSKADAAAPGTAKGPEDPEAPELPMS